MHERFAINVFVALGRCSVAFLLVAQPARGQAAFKPTLDLVIEGSKLPDELRSLVVNRNGLMLAEDAALHMLLFSPAGSLLKTVGGSGSGPGEFRSVTQHGSDGNHWWFFDASLRRLTVLDQAGSLVATETVDVPQAMADKYFLASPIGVSQGGSRLLLALERSGSRALLMSDKTGNARVLLNLEPDPSGIPIRSGNYVSRVRIPFQHRPMWKASSDGAYFAMVRDTMVTPTRGLILVDVVSTDKPTRRIISEAFTGVRITKTAFDSAVADILVTQQRGMRDAAQTALRNLPPDRRPKVVPPVSEILFGQDGTLWLRHPATENGTPWSFYSIAGTKLGTTVLPHGFRLFSARRGQVWGFTRDSLGFRDITRYGLRQLP
jgi:hypothetical protein